MSPFKFVASLAKCIHLYKNLIAEVHSCCANICFNRQCLKQGVIPKNAQLKIPYTSGASQVRQKKTQALFSGSCDRAS